MGDDMIITNNFGVPEEIVRFARSDKYSKGDADISITSLIDAPRVRKLQEIYKNHLSMDVSDRIWSLFGTAVHHVLESSGETPSTVNEERLFTTFAGWKLSGAIDVQRYEPDGSVSIMDYKVCAVWSVLNDKPEWERQLNCYAWLVRRVKQVPVEDLKICAFVRDWSRRKASYDSSYPQSPVTIIDVPVWDADEAEAYVEARVRAHQDTQQRFDFEDPLPRCTDDERWMKPSKWAVMKEGRKTAVKLFNSPKEAELYMSSAKDSSALHVDHRKGEFTRCKENFCGVAEFCEQYKGDENVD
jgi:hypothetical protein